jgi:hypothetical protein
MNGIMAPVSDPQETPDLQGKQLGVPMILALWGPRSPRLPWLFAIHAKVLP